MKTLNQRIPRILEPLLGRYVKVKAAGHTIEGRLVYVDLNPERYSLGNLILEDGSIIRGNLVDAICIERRPTL